MILFEQKRAEFDIKREKELKPKIFVRCGHCGESLSSKKKTRMLDVPGANMVQYLRKNILIFDV